MAQAPNARWFINRLLSYHNLSPELEYKLYGPVNALLSSIFPPSRGYLVKPQAILRSHVPVVSSTVLPPGTGGHPDAVRQSARIAALPGPVHGHSTQLSVDSRTSIDSYGDLTTLRERRSPLPSPIQVPDFIVAKASDYTGAQFDSIVVLLEVKTSELGRNAYVGQVISYLDTLQTKEYVDGFVAYLTLGENTVVWRTEITGTDRIQVQEPREIRTGSRLFMERLEALAR
ncbi:hypothetical protein BKA93DRAFT_753046 [Sparassis latifolia]